MKCKAISKSTHLQCKREAITDGYCTQHYEVMLKEQSENEIKEHLIPDLANIVKEYIEPIKYVVLITSNYPNFNEFVTIKPTTEEALLYVKDKLKKFYDDIKADDSEFEQTLEEYIIVSLQIGEYHLEIIYGIDYDLPIYLNYNDRKFFYRLYEKDWLLSNDENKYNKSLKNKFTA